MQMLNRNSTHTLTYVLTFWRMFWRISGSRFLISFISRSSYLFLFLFHLVNFEDFMGGWNRSTRRKPPTYSRDLFPQHIIKEGWQCTAVTFDWLTCLFVSMLKLLFDHSLCCGVHQLSREDFTHILRLSDSISNQYPICTDFSHLSFTFWSVNSWCKRLLIKVPQCLVTVMVAFKGKYAIFGGSTHTVPYYRSHFRCYVVSYLFQSRTALPRGIPSNVGLPRPPTPPWRWNARLDSPSSTSPVSNGIFGLSYLDLLPYITSLSFQNSWPLSKWPILCVQSQILCEAQRGMHGDFLNRIGSWRMNQPGVIPQNFAKRVLHAQSHHFYLERQTVILWTYNSGACNGWALISFVPC